MKTILVDDELWSMSQFKDECAEIPEIEVVGEFLFAEDALDYARNNLVEFALLDIEMNGMNGVELAKELRKLYPKIIIVFVTSHSKYLKDFIDIKADYYVLKPYSKQDVEDALERALAFSGRLKKRIRVQTFGSFEVYVDGKPVGFKTQKARELLALLVQKRGGVVLPAEAMTCLYDGKIYDKTKSSSYRMTVLRLKDSLEAVGVTDFILTPAHSQGKYIDPKRIECDLYDFLDGVPEARERFNGQYLTEYSWGESTLATLLWESER